MKSFRLAVLILFTFAGVGHADSPNIRITTWNLEWFPNGSAKDASPEEQDRRINAAADVLRKLNPDILLLQEMRDYDACSRLAEAIQPAAYQIAICSAFKGGRQQEAILAKVPAQAAWTETWKSMEGVDPPRGFAFAWFKVRNSDIGVYSVHLKSNLIMHGDKELETAKNIRKREVAAAQLVDHVQNFVPLKMPLIKSIIVGGDFNTNSDQTMFGKEKTLKILSNAGFQASGKNLPLSQRITHPGSHGFPDATFDYLFVRKAVPSKPIITSTAASDHFPLTCDIQMEAATATPDSEATTSTPDESSLATVPLELIDLEIGKPLNLSQYGGPNIDLYILSADIHDIHLSSVDYDHQKTTAVNNVVVTTPSTAQWQVRRTTGFSGTRTLIWDSDQLRVYYVDDIQARQNHVSLAVEN